MSSKLSERINSAGPKKILTCDGGGILGLISVEMLARIEADLRTRLNKPDLVPVSYTHLPRYWCRRRSRTSRRAPGRVC